MKAVHLSEEVLEAYILRRLPAQQMGLENAAEIVAVEEHILCCPACAEAAMALEVFASAMRKVCTREMRADRNAKKTKLKVMSAGDPLGF